MMRSLWPGATPEASAAAAAAAAAAAWDGTRASAPPAVHGTQQQVRRKVLPGGL